MLSIMLVMYTVTPQAGLNWIEPGANEKLYSYITFSAGAEIRSEHTQGPITALDELQILSRRAPMYSTPPTLHIIAVHWKAHKARKRLTRLVY